MQEAALKAINFKKSLAVCYEEIEPILMKELNSLRAKLIALPENTDKEEIMSLFQESVESLNDIANDDSLDAGIDTEEREGLCDALYKMGDIVGLESETEYLDNWRDW
jgi:Domain of unknown function (DUF4844)